MLDAHAFVHQTVRHARRARTDFTAMHIDAFLAWKENSGGDDMAMFMLCAQVADRVRIKTYCEDMGLDYGLMWAWLSATPERMAQLERAREGQADSLLDEVRDIVDTRDEGEGLAGLGHRKLRSETYIRLAAKVNPHRYGDHKGAGGGGAVNISGSDVKVQIVRFAEPENGRPPV